MDRCVSLGPPGPICPISGPQQVGSAGRIAWVYTFLTERSGLMESRRGQASLMRAILGLIAAGLFIGLFVCGGGAFMTVGGGAALIGIGSVIADRPAASPNAKPKSKPKPKRNKKRR